MLVKVTQEHIDRGLRNEPTLCPLALALNPILGKVRIGSCYVYSNEEVCWQLPNKALLFVYDFDNAVTVEPFEFALLEK